jgi:type II secretory pathway pseudopilin PulG
MGATGHRGAALIDIVCTTGLIGVLCAIALPTLNAARESNAAHSAAMFVAARLQQARIEALRRNATVAVRFAPEELNRFAVYVDTDGDGVLASDIDAGIDATIAPEARLSDFIGNVGLRINRNILEPETGASLAAGSDPLRIGRSSLLSFSPLGNATSGTLYLAGETGPQLAIRIFGATGRLRVLRFDEARRPWRED